MNVPTPDEPNDRPSPQRVPQGAATQEKPRAVIRCRLCRETIALETNFRPTGAVCPHCGLRFIFDPQQEPLPVLGLRLRLSEVLEAQRCSPAMRHKRHDAHVQPVAQVSPPQRNYLAWAGGTALSLAAAVAFFGGWFQRLLAR